MGKAVCLSRAPKRNQASGMRDLSEGCQPRAAGHGASPRGEAGRVEGHQGPRVAQLGGKPPPKKVAQPAFRPSTQRRDTTLHPAWTGVASHDEVEPAPADSFPIHGGNSRKIPVPGEKSCIYFRAATIGRWPFNFPSLAFVTRTGMGTLSPQRGEPVEGLFFSAPPCTLSGCWFRHLRVGAGGLSLMRKPLVPKFLKRKRRTISPSAKRREGDVRGQGARRATRMPVRLFVA